MLSDVIAKRNAQKIITNLENATIEIAQVKPNELLYIKACKNSNLSIANNQRFTKIMLESCEQCTIHVPATVQLFTQMIEMINCTQCTIVLSTAHVQAIQCDGLDACVLQFVEPVDKRCKIYWSACKPCTLQTLNGEQQVTSTHDVQMTALQDQQQVQHLSQYTGATGGFKTVETIREGAGVIVTKEDKAKHEQLLKKFEKNFESYLMGQYNLVSSGDGIEEVEEDMELVAQKAKQIAEWIKQSKHCVIYTGAGISTSAGIPDYRGATGLWTQRAKGIEPQKALELGLALPTYTHYAIVELIKQGLCKHVVSTNVDGLHRRSGVPQAQISELHGNIYRETCQKCKKEYLRTYDTNKQVNIKDVHFTGRHCTCGGKLLDSIVHFQESLPEPELNTAYSNADNSDMAIVLGSSLKVAPACTLPLTCTKKKHGKLVIINMQKTPADSKANMLVHAKIDTVMHLVMQYLQMDEFALGYDLLDVMPSEQLVVAEK